MKRLIALLLVCVLAMAGCGNQPVQNVGNDEEPSNMPVLNDIPEDEIGDTADYIYEPDFSRLDDKKLLTYVEDNIYNEVVAGLADSGYYVQNVSATYVSKEYLEERAYNSQSNIFFGFTLEEIEAVYGDSKFVFTLGDDGTTVVQPFEDYDDTYTRIIKNVAIGTGVILVCVTVSAVTAGAGAPAVSLIFAASAKTGTVMALSSGVIGGVATGIVTGIETGDFSQAIKAGALEASEGFKWGAITGAIVGGTSESVKYAKAIKALKGADLNITMQEAAAIQMQTGYPVDVITQFHSMEEFEVFKDAGLRATMVNGQNALIRKDINLKQLDAYGRTNLERMKLGLSALDKSGTPFELHHIGQEADASLAILTQAEHDNAVLHGFKTISEIDRTAFATQRSQFWKTVAKILESGALK